MEKTTRNDGLRACDSFNIECPASSHWYTHDDAKLQTDYTSWPEAVEYLENLDAFDNDIGNNNVMAILPIGTVQEEGIYPWTDPIEFFAVKLTMAVDEGPYEDRPDSLFIAGMHADEWLTTELLMHYIDRFVKEGNDGDTTDPIDQLLWDYEIWIVPYASPHTRLFDDDASWGDPAAGRGRRKTLSQPPDFSCLADWDAIPHHGNCGSDTDWVSEWDGINLSRNFSRGWGYNRENGAPYDRHERFGDVLPPELDDTRADDSECEEKYPSHPNHVVLDSTTGMSGCFFLEPFVNSVETLARGSCLSQLYTLGSSITLGGVVHNACLEIPQDGGNFRFVIAECGTSGSSFNDAGSPFYSYPVVNDEFQICVNGIRFDCFEDADCVQLQAHGVLPGEWGDGGEAICKQNLDKLAALPTNSVGDPMAPGYCAIDPRTTCCDRDFAGLRPFDAVDSRMLRDLISNVPFVSVMDLHAFRGETTFVNKGDYGFDRDNGIEIIQEATDIFNEGAKDRWSDIYPTDPDPQPDFAKAFRGGYGAGGGQMLGWVATESSSTGFDKSTLRAMNAFGMEVPPRVGFGNNEFITCGATDAGPIYPRSQMMVSQTVDGFARMGDYLIRQTSNPNFGRDENGNLLAANTNLADIALVGGMIHDGLGKGVMTSRYDVPPGDTDAEITIPAGIWALSFDIIHQCDGTGCPGGVLPILNVNTDIAIQRQIASITGPLYLFDTVFSVNGNLSPNSTERWTRRFEFKAGTTYIVQMKYKGVTGHAIGYQNEDEINDFKRLKVRAVSCLDEDDRPNDLPENEYCRHRIEGDETRFRCDEDLESCAECYIDPTTETISDCEDLWGDGAFCVAGMCDTPDVCWSAAFEDPFEGIEPREVQGTFNATTRWNATLHRKIGGQDTDRIRYRYTVPYQAIGGRTLKLAVGAICAADEVEWIGDEVLEYRAVVGWSDLPVLFDPNMTLIDWTTVTLIDWDEPGPAYLSTITLTDVQAQAVFHGAPITVSVRSVADSVGNFPSVVYGVSMGILGGGELADLTEDWEKLIVPPYEPVTLVDTGTSGSVLTIVPDSGRVAAGDTLVFRVDGASGGASRTARVLVTDIVGDSVGQVIRSDTAIFVQLSSLDLRDGPFNVYVQSTSDPISGTVYHCPANTPDCEQFDPSHDACNGDSCANGAVCCRGANEYAECIDLLHDPDNCGACGWPCGPNETCLEGVCAIVTSLDCEGTTCPSGLSCCEDVNGLPSCLERKSDSDNCGWCGHVCAANKRCELGLCIPRWGEKCGATCTGGKTCCYGVLGGNQCVNMTNNRFSCGKCGNVCGLDETCSGGKCQPWLAVVDPCWGGRVNCGAPLWIDCRDLVNDSDNCGGCGHECPGDSNCVAGQCTGDDLEAVFDNCGE